MKSWELIKALDEGKTLIRVHHNDLDCVERMQLEVYNNLDKIVKKLECYGWGSAIGMPMDRIKCMLEDPEYCEQWKIKE